MRIKETNELLAIQTVALLSLNMFSESVIALRLIVENKENAGTVVKVEVEMKLGKVDEKGEKLNLKDRKDSQGFVDITKKTVNELQELIERQNRLLQNRCFLKKLPDGGRKIIDFKTELESQLKKKLSQYEETCELLTNLSLREKVVEELEWRDGAPDMNKQCDSDDDDEEEEEKGSGKIDPLKLIATHSGTVSSKQTKMKFSSSNNSNVSLQEEKLYAEKLSLKIDKSARTKDRFKPNQLRNNDKSLFAVSAEKLKERLGNKWEVTEATPPVPVYHDTVLISLSESLKLQKEQAEKLKELAKKQAAEKLLENISLKMGKNLPENNLTNYRTNEEEINETEEEEETISSSCEEEE